MRLVGADRVQDAMGITIKIDSREQQPYSFDGPVEVGALSTGDYSICGLENHVAIERKTLDDLIGCLTQGRERFERELHRGRALDYFAVVVETSLSAIANGRYRSKMLPKSAIQSLLTFSIRYISCLFSFVSRELTPSALLSRFF